MEINAIIPNVELLSNFPLNTTLLVLENQNYRLYKEKKRKMVNK